MSQSEATWTGEVYLVVLREDGAVWLEEGTLPRIEIQRRFWSAETKALVPQLKQRFGTAIVLRCLHIHSDKDAQRIQAVYELEANPLGGRWATIGEVTGLELEPEIHNALKNSLNHPISELRVAWAKPGWFGQASSWMRSELVRLGYWVDEIEQVKSWFLSCVLRAKTDRGEVYFKVANHRPLFCHEPTLTLALAERFPDLVPRPLSIQAAERWMLLPDIGQDLYEHTVGLETWAELMGHYAQMQRSLEGDVEWLLSIGCLDRRPAVLKHQFNQLLQNPQALMGLSEEEIEQLRRLEPKLLNSCDRLEALGIPHTLLHGDLHPGNVAHKDGQYRFFDWTDACVAHPFLDFPYFMDSVAGLLGEEARKPLAKAYLEPWSDLVSVEHLEANLELIETVGYMHQTVSYWKIAETLEANDQSGMDGVVLGYLRQMMKRAQGSEDRGQ